MQMTLSEIKKILPHREPFLMMDRADDVVPGDYADTRKVVSANEWFFQGHFKDFKVMPGVLLVEAMAQAGALTILTDERFKGKIAFFGGIKKARFRKKVIPGDVLIIHAKITRILGEVGFGKGEIRVDDKLVADCELIFSLGYAEQT